MTYSIVLASEPSSVLTGLDGTLLQHLSLQQAKALKKELETVWANELHGDSLVLMREADAVVLIHYEMDGSVSEKWEHLGIADGRDIAESVAMYAGIRIEFLEWGPIPGVFDPTTGQQQNGWLVYGEKTR